MDATACLVSVLNAPSLITYPRYRRYLRQNLDFPKAMVRLASFNAFATSSNKLRCLIGDHPDKRQSELPVPLVETNFVVLTQAERHYGKLLERSPRNRKRSVFPAFRLQLNLPKRMLEIHAVDIYRVIYSTENRVYIL